MRRSFLRLTASFACAMVASAVLPTPVVFARSASATFDALKQPSLPTARGPGAAMLAITKAGNRLVAVGERGIILLSDDNGSTWAQSKVPVSVTLTAVQFVNPNQGWATGHLGVVLHTEDGGKTWVQQLDGIQAGLLALDAAKKSTDTRQGERAKQLAAAQALVDDGPDKPFLDLYFKDAKTGYVVGAYNLIFRTDDGGHSWRPWLSQTDNPKGLHLYGIKSVGDALYIVGEQGLMLRAIGIGGKFESLKAPSKGTYFGLIDAGGGKLLVYGLRGRAFWSGDRADSWVEISSSTQSSISTGFRLHDGTMILATQEGELLVSHDGGRSFKSARQSASLPITGVVEAAGRLVVSSLRGVSVIDIPKITH